MPGERLIFPGTPVDGGGLGKPDIARHALRVPEMPN